LPWLRDTYKAEKNTVKYYINHTYILATFRDHSKVELPKVAKTRFSSCYTLLRHLLDCKEQLITTICLSKWKKLVKNAHAAMGAQVPNIIKKDDFRNKDENIMRMSQLIEKIMNIAFNKQPAISPKS